MQRHECNKHNYLCINDSLKFLFPYENQGVTGALCDILAQGLIRLIEYSYHQGIHSFLECRLQRTLG
jgi:hypothetical protein